MTTIEWHPSEASVFASGGADDQIALWDLALERDSEECDDDVKVINNNQFTYIYHIEKQSTEALLSVLPIPSTPMPLALLATSCSSSAAFCVMPSLWEKPNNLSFNMHGHRFSSNNPDNLCFWAQPTPDLTTPL